MPFPPRLLSYLLEWNQGMDQAHIDFLPNSPANARSACYLSGYSGVRFGCMHVAWCIRRSQLIKAASVLAATTRREQCTSVCLFGDLVRLFSSVSPTAAWNAVKVVAAKKIWDEKTAVLNSTSDISLSVWNNIVIYGRFFFKIEVE